MNLNQLSIRRQHRLLTASSPQNVGSILRLVFISLCIFYAQTTTLAIQLTSSNRNDTDCVDLRMILVFEDRPIDVTINLHTVSNDANNIPPQYYWENYVPFSRMNVSTTTFLEEICVPKNGCYLLQVVDNGKIGWNGNETLEATDTDLSRSFSISFDQTMIGIYDSRLSNSCYSVQWYQFGYSCNDDTTDEEEEEVDSGIDDRNIDSTIISIYRGSLPCQTSTEATNTGSSSNETSTTDTSDPDEAILKSSNVTLIFSGPASTDEPTFSPTQELELQQSDTPSVSSEPSVIPTTIPTISTIPSLVLISTSNSPIIADIRPAITMPPDMQLDIPTSLIASSTAPSDVPSIFPSMVPTAKCVDFFMIVVLDEHPEDMKLTLTSTNEHGSEDDIVIWDRIRPWRSDENNTFFAHQIVNQTTCIYEEECYTFIVEDIAQDGLTTPEKQSSINLDDSSSETEFVANVEIPTMNGYYTLSYGTDRIISYYDGNVDGCYRKKIYKFGLSMTCAMTESTEPSDRSCPQVRRRR